MRPSKGEMLCRIQTLESKVEFLEKRVRQADRTNEQLQFVLDELAKNSGWRVGYRQEGYYLTPLIKKPEEPYGN